MANQQLESNIYFWNVQFNKVSVLKIKGYVLIISRNEANGSKGTVGQKGEIEHGEREEDFNNNKGTSIGF